ncbi:MAG: translocation/assembly module TamB domain-containing protein [Steroidobacteraceae bacterium]
MKRRNLVIGIAGVTVVLVGGVGWLLYTQAGARFVAARAQGFLAPKLDIGGIEGRLAGPLRVTDLRWTDPESGVAATLARAEIDLSLGRLIGGTVHVERFAAEGLNVALTQGTRPPEPDEPGGNPLDPPIAIVIDQFSLRDARVTSEGEELVHVRDASLAAAWTAASLDLRKLDVVADQGEIHFVANVTGGAKEPRVYAGTGTGRFRWKTADQELAGTLEARAADALADLKVQLSEPAVADLTLSLKQEQRLPWNFSLQAPAFDPREKLMPGSSLARLAVDLRGSGSLDEAAAQGSVLLNQSTIAIETLAARRDGEAVALVGAVGFGGGRLNLDGKLQPSATPLAGQFELKWQDIVVPADLVGQELHTAGRIDAGGTVDAYRATGSLKIGPPKQLADIQLDVTGTPERVQLARFDIVQPQGRLAAAGVVELKPQLRWTVGAAGRAFDPGALLSEWPGRLDFSLATDGRQRDEGIEARFVLQDLKGTLRQRRIAGAAQLQLEADKALVGNADVSSGASRVRIEASRNANEEALAHAILEVANLGDWLPGARGRINGTVDAKGRWPDLAVTTNLQGGGIDVDGNAIASFRLDADITKPLEPSGTVALVAEGASAAGFDFTSIRLNAEGDQSSHRVRFDAQGPRIGLGADVAGKLADSTWSGEISRLQIKATDIANLSLQQPFALQASATKSTLSQACLADGDIRLCAEGEMGEAGTFQARYSVQSLPLKLAQAFATLPVGLEGTLDGEGDVRRDAQGSMAGEARLRSGAGRILEAVAQGEEARELLAWRELQVNAAMQGETAQGDVKAVLNEQGNLEGRVSASALTSADPQLDGQVSLKLPGLGVVEAFTPQLMNVEGSLSMQARIAGPLSAPRVDGEARLSGLGFDLPELNLKPRGGEIVVRAAGTGDQPLQVDGSLKSGDGTLKFAGQAGLNGEAKLKVTGTNVLAADIPGVRVTLTPDLDVNRTAARTELGGSVRIPSASIDLQRLPNAKRTRSASPDVVVIDDEAAETVAQSAPVQASIEVSLGDDVKIKGYGLDASVAGEIDVRERPGEPTTASGELRVAGKYQAYGQDLTIQQGQLLYAGTAIDNPRLAITAIRTVDTVTAGFRVTGSARNPELNVFSDPAMGQANALSYIVAGKPLDQIGQGTGEGDALQSAARQLGTAAGGLLAKNVGKRLGVDELGIKDSAAIGGAALTVGQYLSPRLYLGYGVGLFEPGQVVTLRYRLSREFNFQAEQGTLNSRAGIEFRKEK